MYLSTLSAQGPLFNLSPLQKRECIDRHFTPYSANNFKKQVFLFMHICMCLQEFMYTTYVQVLMKAGGHRSPGTGTTAVCESPDIGAKKGTMSSLRMQ